MTKPRRIAMLVELPVGLENAQLAALRRFLKALARSFGIRCLSVLPPSETKTFGSQAGMAKINQAASDGHQATTTRSGDENALDAKPAGPAKPSKRKRRTLSKGPRT